jgi:hypothetical protein
MTLKTGSLHPDVVAFVKALVEPYMGWGPKVPLITPDIEREIMGCLKELQAAGHKVDLVITYGHYSSGYGGRFTSYYFGGFDDQADPH